MHSHLLSHKHIPTCYYVIAATNTTRLPSVAQVLDHTCWTAWPTYLPVQLSSNWDEVTGIYCTRYILDELEKVGCEGWEHSWCPNWLSMNINIEHEANFEVWIVRSWKSAVAWSGSSGAGQQSSASACCGVRWSTSRNQSGLLTSSSKGDFEPSCCLCWSFNGILMVRSTYSQPEKQEVMNVNQWWLRPRNWMCQKHWPCGYI